MKIMTTNQVIKHKRGGSFGQIIRGPNNKNKDKELIYANPDSEDSVELNLLKQSTKRKRVRFESISINDREPIIVNHDEDSIQHEELKSFKFPSLAPPPQPTTSSPVITSNTKIDSEMPAAHDMIQCFSKY